MIYFGLPGLKVVAPVLVATDPEISKHFTKAGAVVPDLGWEMKVQGCGTGPNILSISVVQPQHLAPWTLGASSSYSFL